MSSSACNTRDKSLVVIYKSNPVGVALINRQYRNGSVEYLVYLFPGMKRGRPSRNGMYRCREDHSRREGIVVCIEKKFDNFFPPFFCPSERKIPSIHGSAADQCYRSQKHTRSTEPTGNHRRIMGLVSFGPVAGLGGRRGERPTNHGGRQELHDRQGPAAPLKG